MPACGYVFASKKTWDDLGLPNSWPTDPTVVSFETRPDIMQAMLRSSRQTSEPDVFHRFQSGQDDDRKRRRLHRHDSSVGTVPIDVFNPGPGCGLGKFVHKDVSGLAAQFYSHRVAASSQDEGADEG